MTHHSIFLKKLQALGLTEKQALIYLAVLKKKQSTVLDISRETHIQRPTIYENARILEDLGLFVTTLKGSKRFLSPTEPEKIYSLIEEKRVVAKELVDDIVALKNYEPIHAPITLYSGHRGAKQLLDALLHAKEKKILTFGSYDLIYSLFSERELRKFWAIRSQKDISVHALFPASDEPFLLKNHDYSENSNIRYNREVRVFPSSVEFHVVYSILDDQVFFWSSPQENFFFNFSSPSYASSLRSVFETMWSLSRSLHNPSSPVVNVV